MGLFLNGIGWLLLFSIPILMFFNYLELIPKFLLVGCFLIIIPENIIEK